MLNIILEKEETSASWSEILVSMLHKKGKQNNPNNYRPKALVNTILKLFTFLLYVHLEDWVVPRDVFPEFQSGFRKSHGCTDNIFVLNALIQEALNGIKGLLFFVDFRRAFPSFNHNILMRMLGSYGLSSKIMRILANLYSLID